MQHQILNGVLLYIKDVNLESIHLKINKINIIYYYSIKITINNIVLTVPSLIFVISDSSNSSSSSVNSSFSSEIYDEISLVFEQSLSVSMSPLSSSSSQSLLSRLGLSLFPL